MSHAPCGLQESAMGSVVCSTRSKHGNRIPACRARNHMDDLSLQIAAGLPLAWVPAPQPFDLPDHAVNLYSASNGSRRLMFILVKGPLTSAMPLISANANLRKSGVETVWLFDENPIPSTRHMPCVSIRKMGYASVATISNIGQDASAEPQMMEIAQLAKAAAENRMRVADFQAGCNVNVTITSAEVACVKCGAISFSVERAKFYPVDHPGAPGLELKKSKIGRSLSSLITNALKWYYPIQNCVCNGCIAQLGRGRTVNRIVTMRIGPIELSKLAALELIRHNNTAWYVSHPPLSA